MDDSPRMIRMRPGDRYLVGGRLAENWRFGHLGRRLQEVAVRYIAGVDGRHAVEPVRHQALSPKRERHERIIVEDSSLIYNGQDDGRVGVYIAAEPLTPHNNYYEVVIMDTGLRATIAVGVAPHKYPLDRQPGWNTDSVGYHADDGRLYKANGHGRPFGPKCNVWDKVGCGIKFDQMTREGSAQPMVPVFFTHNGKELGTVIVALPPEGLHPAIGLHSEAEEVRLNLDAVWDLHDVDLMAIDNHDEDWARLHDVRLNGQMLEYTGRGKSIIDVGLAQARRPLDTMHHYFEIEITDPGESRYIAIGLARKNYPQHRHPGWNKGSIAYHADDGKIFIGSGTGDQFGPQCNKGDIMGCGILFPRDFASAGLSGRDSSDDLSDSDNERDFIDVDETNTDSEDDEWWERPHAESGLQVQVFFTRNGKTIGHRNVRIPKGGFYPTVGMLSSDEKVKVDLRPLTG